MMSIKFAIFSLYFIAMLSHGDSIRADITGDGVDEIITSYTTEDKQYKGFKIEIPSSNQTLIYNTLIPILHNPNGWDYALFDVTVAQELMIYDKPYVPADDLIEDNKRLLLQSSIDGAPFLQQLYLRYDSASNRFLFDKLYHITFNEYCDHEVNAVYQMNVKDLNDKNIIDVNANILKAITDPSNIEKYIDNKILSKNTYEIYNEALMAFKSNNLNGLKTLVENKMLHYDHNDQPCRANDYISRKYFFPKKMGLPENLWVFIRSKGALPLAAELTPPSPGGRVPAS